MTQKFFENTENGQVIFRVLLCNTITSNLIAVIFYNKNDNNLQNYPKVSSNFGKIQLTVKLKDKYQLQKQTDKSVSYKFN